MVSLIYCFEQSSIPPRKQMERESVKGGLFYSMRETALFLSKVYDSDLLFDVYLHFSILTCRFYALSC